VKGEARKGGGRERERREPGCKNIKRRGAVKKNWGGCFIKSLLPSSRTRDRDTIVYTVGKRKIVMSVQD